MKSRAVLSRCWRINRSYWLMMRADMVRRADIIRMIARALALIAAAPVYNSTMIAII